MTYNANIPSQDGVQVQRVSDRLQLYKTSTEKYEKKYQVVKQDQANYSIYH